MTKAPAAQNLDRVVVGMDPHKRSVTIEVIAGDEAILSGGRFATTAEGYQAMRRYVAQWPAGLGDRGLRRDRRPRRQPAARRW
jgi:hypothetical protein